MVQREGVKVQAAWRSIVLSSPPANTVYNAKAKCSEVFIESEASFPKDLVYGQES